MLSHEELAVLRLLGAGYSDVPAAARLGLSDRTLRRRLGSAMTALGARTRFHAGALAERAGLLGAGSGQPRGQGAAAATPNKHSSTGEET